MILSTKAFSLNLEFFHEKKLDTKEGRLFFLEEKVKPLIRQLTNLNGEIEALSLQVRSLSAESDQRQLVQLGMEIAEKMDRLGKALPLMQDLASLDQDFLDLEAVLENPCQISSEQEKILERIEKIVLQSEIFLEKGI